MIIDVHTHIWSNLQQLGIRIADRLRIRGFERPGFAEVTHSNHEPAMSCVDAAFVFGFRSERLGARIPNELIAEFISRQPQRLIGIAGIDPLSADAESQIESSRHMGLAGVTVSPACQGFHPAHSAAMRVYEQCAVMRMPLFVASIDSLTPGAVLEFGRPSLWDEVAQSFPHLPIVISQMGYPWIDETLVLVGQHKNVFADISSVVSRPWQLYNAMLSAASLGVMDKLLFGSGFPFESPAKAIETMYSINSYSHGSQMPSVPRPQIRSIVERDSLTCLGIEAELPSTRRAAAANDGLPMAKPHQLSAAAERQPSSIR